MNSTVKIRDRVKGSQLLTIKKIAAETNRLIQHEHANIISLSQGVPNLPLFDDAVEAMVSLLRSKKLPYTDVAGILEVRETVADFINLLYHRNSHPNRVPFTSNNIVITAGAIQAVYNALALSIESPEDVVASPLPAYGLYKHQTEILGGTFVEINTAASNGYVPTVDDLQDLFDKCKQQSKKVRSIVLCYPNNPTGTLLTVHQAKEIASFLDKKLTELDGFSVILDEVYLGITLGETDPETSILSHASSRLINNTFLILSASKGLGAMPGARAGVLCSLNQSLIDNVLKIQTACSANASIVSQEGLRASFLYLMKNQGVLREIASHYFERVFLAKKRLEEISKKYLNSAVIVNDSPQATFYLMVDFSSISQMHTDIELHEFFRDMYKHGKKKAGVALVPGSAFGIPPSNKVLRMSCAVDLSDIERAMDIIEEAIELIQNDKKVN